MSAIKKLRKYLRPLRRWYGAMQSRYALLRHKLYYKSRFSTQPHTLDGTLYISLTSYPPRFPFLKHTLESLIAQSVKADKILLWIAQEDMPLLPHDIRALQDKGVEIRETENTRSFKKLVPAIEAFPDAYIVTADDDVYYPPQWLKDLLACHDGSRKSVVCHVANGIVFNEEGKPAPYNDWRWCIRTPRTGEKFLPVGIGGVLYSPDALQKPLVLDRNIFMDLCPMADDFWFYFMGRLNGANYIKTTYKGFPVTWPQSQKISLAAENTGRSSGKPLNDVQLANLLEKFGNILR